MRAKNPPVLHYVCLALLFALASAYQIRSAIFAFPNYFHLKVAVYPFTPNYDKGRPVIQFPTKNARQSGIQNGDTLLAVNGRPVTGLAVFGEAIRTAKPGDILTVQFLRHGDAAPRLATFSLEQAIAPPISLPAASLLIVKLVIPTFCILLGFWVTAVRPRDPSAWCLFLIMLFFSVFYSAGVESWGPVVRDVAEAYRLTVANTWPIFMLLFGLYFPEPFTERDPAWWTWAKRTVITLLIVSCVVNVIAGLGQLENFASVAPLSAVVDRLSSVDFLLSFAAIGAFFACIATKMRQAVTPDAKRRLRLLYVGSSVSMGPACILFIVQNIKGGELEQIFPEWLVLSALSLMLLFPITLAYVIVVHRAMDVRVVIRQGLQYGLAKTGIRVLQFAAIAIVIATAFAMGSNKNTFGKVVVIAVAVTIGLMIPRLGERLKDWTDRRFFREAYNAEQVLSDLSDQVRSMVETRPLIETVAARISETLHIPQVAVLLGADGTYHPAYALGYNTVPTVNFLSSAGTAKVLRAQQEPARVYFDDPDSWVYRDPGVSEEERAKLAQLHAELLLPLSTRDKLLGFISLGPKRSDEPYSGSDVRLLKSVAAQTGLALENARLMSAIADEVAQRERLNREVEIAREVQERLFPQTLPPIAGIEYSGACRPALGVGGDYYDFLALPGGHLGIAIGDVSGKGIAAALMMASLQASLRAEATRAPKNLAGLVGNVNRLLYEASSDNRYATFFYAQYDPETRQLTYVNAGHNPPMLFHRDGEKWEITRLEAGGAVVGLLETFSYQQSTVIIARGDVFIAFTDGISEAMNVADDEWGEAQLIETVKQCGGLASSQIIARIMQATDGFVAGAKQHDDMTLVVLCAKS